MRKATKIVISFAVVLIAGLNLIVPAIAQDPFTAIAVGGLTGASGAGLFGSMAGMSGIDIGWSSSGSDPMDAMWNVLNPDHVYFTGEKHEATNIDEDIYDYISVDIGDWLQAQRDFIDEFVSNYNVTDDSSGTTTAAYAGSYAGYPLYYDKISAYSLGTITQNCVFEVGAAKLVIQDWFARTYFNNVQKDFFNLGSGVAGREVVLYCTNGNDNYAQWAFKTGSGSLPFSGIPRSACSTTNKTVNWSSGDVDTSVFDGWEKAKVKIPSSISQLQTGWTLTDFLNELNRIWSGAGEDNIIIEEDHAPVPPVPVPDTPLGEVPFDDWVDLWGQGIYQQLENQSDTLDLIGSNGIDAIEELESIDTNTEDLVEVAESIDTNIGVGNGILGGIRSLAQSAVDYLEGIAEHVGELVEEIVEGTETLIAGILNQIPQVFSVIFGPIKQASSIWHYVVEWITSIGAPFQFIWSMASGTSYYIILPVYASLAAAVVLAFYKRFGK